jgi:putative MATE family efflux protein
VLAPAVAAAGVWFMDGGPRVSEALSTYVGIRLLSAPLALCNYAILGYFIGRGEAGVALGLQIVLNGVNIALSIFLGLTLEWGVEGVAWATVAGEAIACAAGFLLILWRFRGETLHLRRSLTAIAELRRMLALNGDIMIRSFVLLAAFALLTRQGAQLGTLTLAVNAVLMNFFLVAGYFLDGYATAAEQLAGRAVGAGREREFRAAVRLTGIWGFATAGVVTVIALIWGDALVALITTSPEIRAEASIYLPWAALTAVSGVLAFQMDGVFIGATWSRDMRNMMLLSFAVFVAALLVLPSLAANHGLWAALHVFLLARGVSLYAIMTRRIRTAFPPHASTEADAH